MKIKLLTGVILLMLCAPVAKSDLLFENKKQFIHSETWQKIYSIHEIEVFAKLNDKNSIDILLENTSNSPKEFNLIINGQSLKKISLKGQEKTTLNNIETNNLHSLSLLSVNLEF